MEVSPRHYSSRLSSRLETIARILEQRSSTRFQSQAEVSSPQQAIYPTRPSSIFVEAQISQTHRDRIQESSTTKINDPTASTTIFSLPLELRIQIYNLVLPDSPSIRFTRELLPKATAVHQPLGAKLHRHRYRIPALLQTSRQLRSEAASFYFSSPDLVLEIDSDELTEFLRFMTSERRYIAPLHRGMVVSNPALLMKVTGHLSWKSMRLVLDWLTTSVPAALEWHIMIQRERECCRLEQHLASVAREAGDAMEVARAAGSLVKQTEVGMLRRQMVVAKKLRSSLSMVV